MNAAEKRKRLGVQIILRMLADAKLDWDNRILWESGCELWDLLVDEQMARMADLERRVKELESQALPYCGYCGATDCDH